MQFLLLLFLSTVALITAAPVAEVKNATEDWYTKVGDMRIPKTTNNKLLRNGEPSHDSRWPKGVIPYVIGPDFTATERNHILQAINDYHLYTCIRWVPRTNQGNYVNIQKRAGDGGCWSYVGRLNNYVNDVNLATWCVANSKGISLHELNHAVGFHHEQDRIDRDDYLTIVWKNIAQGDRGGYDKIVTSSFGVPYDYNSAMHYETDRNNPTMVAKFGTNVFLGAGTSGLSSSDLEKIRRMYKCEGSVSRL